MRLDDIADDLASRNASYVAALSTVAVPLQTITSAQIARREYRDPVGKCTVFIDSGAEEVEELAPSFRVVTLPVDIHVFTMGATEAVLREQAAAYAQAILNCMAANPYFFSMISRDHFDGVEGKADIKATKLSIQFKYEEAV